MNNRKIEDRLDSLSDEMYNIAIDMIGCDDDEMVKHGNELKNASQMAASWAQEICKEYDAKKRD